VLVFGVPAFTKTAVHPHEPVRNLGAAVVVWGDGAAALQSSRGGEMELELGAEMMNELTEAARDCQLTPRQFAIESLESVLASRRLPRVECGSHGAFTSGWRGDVEDL